MEETLLFNRASQACSVRGAALALPWEPAPKPRELHWDLQGHLLGPAAAGVALLSPRAQRGEEGPAGCVPERQMGTALVAVLSCSHMTEEQ